MANFRITFPCGVLVNKSCVATKEGVSKFIADPLWLCLANNEGTGAIPIFTGEDAATAFCVASNKVGEVTMIVVEDARRLIDILTQVGENYGIEEVTINPKKDTGRAWRYWPIGEAIEQLRRKGPKVG